MQIQGSGASNFTNTAMVDDSKRLWTNVSGAVVVKDNEGNDVEYPDINEDGTRKVQAVSDENCRSLLNGILKQLKIMNLHLLIISDNDIQKTEVD